MAFRECIQCGKGFEYKRADHFFCSKRCCARFYRENPDPNMIHHDLPHEMPHVCEHCGQPYNVNAYAERGGQRPPKYCSGKCKQAAYRARGQTAQEQAHRRYENEQRQERQRQEQNWRREEQPQQHKRRTAGSTGMDAQRAWRVLGVSPNAPIGTIREAWRAMMKRYHPDVYKGSDATQRAQEINAAYEYLKKRQGK